MMYAIISGEGEILATVGNTALAELCVDYIRTEAKESNMSIPRLIVRNVDTGEYYNKYDGDPVIEELDLCVRSYNCLKRAGYGYASDITSMSIQQISKIRNLGPKCTKEVVDKICDLLCTKI